MVYDCPAPFCLVPVLARAGHSCIESAAVYKIPRSRSFFSAALIDCLRWRLVLLFSLTTSPFFAAVTRSHQSRNASRDVILLLPRKMVGSLIPATPDVAQRHVVGGTLAARGPAP